AKITIGAAADLQPARKGGRHDADCDFRVAAHDDHPLSRYTCPALTTMAQDFAAMAGRSVEILLALLDEADPPGHDMARNVKLGATLVMRQSA
ncbi:substrate-binding domain-containing protein, partial [Mesorhizobium sp. M1C.F.Ca.ET.187.01.1.1]|uniref:substrate-binding domain-containing protein n=1 Tax=Mesorhizobium sp. M1C.F.Ca.ET.187.01.1.1 TaxID=2563923 RepID=UPI001FE1C6A2